MFNFSSFFSNCWIILSSSRLVQIYAVLLYSFSSSLNSCDILSTCIVASFSLLSHTSRGVLRVNFSINSVISYLYLSMVCTICCIFSFVGTSCACAHLGILMYTSMRFLSKLFVHCFSSSFSSIIFSHVTCIILFTSWSIARLVTSSLSLDYSSCIILSSSPYNAFVGICARTNSI
jgi:hypothetical protein